MQSYRLQICPQSAFGTALLGDTLFGQLCWALRNRYGEAHLCELLEGYTADKPFAVVSNAFPTGFVPRPALPAIWFANIPDTERKAMKKKHWLPLAHVTTPLQDWLRHCQTDEESGAMAEIHPQPHNSISRLTGTTGGVGFDPYAMTQYWYNKGATLDIYLLLDESRTSANDIETCLCDIGSFGFGRDASIGLGKFSIQSFEKIALPAQANANVCLTLAPCAPQGLGFDAKRSFYQPFTRFGRHGDRAVHQTGQPFKNPVLLAQAGAVFSVEPPQTGFIGQGLGGNGELSRTIEGTVHQGYSPVSPIFLPASAEQVT